MIVSSRDERTYRFAGAAGLLGVALLAVALFLPGAPPRSDQPASQIAALALEHRNELTLGSVIALVGAGFLAWFIAGLLVSLRSTGRPIVLAAAGAAAIAGVLLVVIGVVVVSGLVLETINSGDDDLVRLVTDTSNIVIQMGLVALAGFVVAVSVVAPGRSGFMVRFLGIGGAAAIAGSSIPPLIVTSGPWQFGGVAAVACTTPMMAWFLVTAGLMTRRSMPPAVNVTSANSR
jgi:hypothetical protein